LGVLGLLLGASSARAVIVHLPSGKTLSYMPLRGGLRTIKPFDKTFKNLDYNGGPVMASNTNYTFYWRPSGAPAYPLGYKAGVNRYLEDLAHDSGGHENVDSVAAQYNDATGEFASYNSRFGGEIVDEEPYPTNECKERATICLTDAQIQAELKKFLKAHGLPLDLGHEYFVLTPPTVESCFEAAPHATECSAGVTPEEDAVYCAYHNDAPTEAGGKLIYANDPYVTGNAGCDKGDHPNGSPSDGVIQGGLSHEHNESITDPLPNSGWTDFATGEKTGYEVGDKCDTGAEESEFGPALGEVEVEEEIGGKVEKVKAKYNQVVDGHFYWYQQEWSNQGAECLQRLTFAGTEPSATFVSKPAGVTALTFEATASSAPGGVSRYSWQFNDESAPVETATPTVTHTFPEEGFYPVALTVYSPDGTSLGSEDIVETGHTSPSAAFSVSTAAPAATVPTQFDASASGGTIVGYEWNFGDGSGGLGQTPSHVYAKPGTYSITLFVEDTFGQIVTVSHQVTVGAAPPPESGGGSGGGTGGGSGGASVIAPPSIAHLTTLPTGSVALLATKISIGANGSGPVKLSCTGTAACSGRLTLTVKVKSRHKRTRTVTLGSASFSIAAGATGTVTLKLSAAGRAQLKAAHGHLGAVLSIAKSSPVPASTQTRTVQLRQKRKK
jgi:PKD repeat protein